MREEIVRRFLSENGWDGARRTPLAGDASARRYERLARPGETAILMDVPPGSGLSTRPFLAVARWLASGGFSAPVILAADDGAGLVLLEDLGDDLFAVLCARQPGIERDLYAAAVDCLAAIHDRPPPASDTGWTAPPYDSAILMREARLAVEWYLPAATGEDGGERVAEFACLAETALAGIPASRPSVVYRDYHAENLVWLPGRAGAARVGLLDFQDMLAGHPAYDLVSLLEDARRDVGAELREAMIARYIARTGAEAGPFRRAARILSAQRNLKILGLFTRLCRRDGKPRYLEYLPRVWSHLMHDLREPDLAALRSWVVANLPAPEPHVRAAISGIAA
jgi:N-acetylmuramate 1-kinase